MVRKRIIILFSLLLLGFIALSVCPQPVKAQYQDNITINADGSVDPKTAPIVQSGNFYSLTSDINGTITINKSNIIIDGNNHKVLVPSIFNSGITFYQVHNSTVTHFSVLGGKFGINVYGSQNIVKDNTISSVSNGIYSLDQPTGGIALSGISNKITGNRLQSNLVGINFFGDSPNINCSNNLITENTFSDCSTALLFYDSSNNTFCHNNFLNNKVNVFDTGTKMYPQIVSENIWDDGYPLGGNFWSDYKGDGVYVIDQNNVDNNPLNKIFIIYQQPNPTQTPTPTSIENLAPTIPYLPSDRNAPHLDPIYYLIPITMVFVAIAVSVLIFRRHRKTAGSVKKV